MLSAAFYTAKWMVAVSRPVTESLAEEALRGAGFFIRLDFNVNVEHTC